MTPHALIAAILVLLAAGTGLLWPKSNIQAQYFDQPPTPVKTIPYRHESPSEIAPGAKGWPSHDVNVPMAVWRVRSDGLWVPWTLDPPTWLTTIAGSYLVAETVPTPPERPPQLRETEGAPRREVLPKRMAREAPNTCERVGLRKIYTDRWRWRCR